MHIIRKLNACPVVVTDPKPKYEPFITYNGHFNSVQVLFMLFSYSNKMWYNNEIQCFFIYHGLLLF